MRARQRRAGYSLLEVIMAGAIFAVGFAAIISAVSSFMNVVEHDRRLSEAWRLLQGQATHLRAMPADAAAWDESTTVTTDAFGMPGDEYTIERVPVQDKPFTGAQRLTITVRWQERVGERTAELVIQR